MCIRDRTNDDEDNLMVSVMVEKISKNIQTTARDLRYELLIEFCR